MQPIAKLGNDEAKRLRGLLFDLDDTLLDHGTLGELAYASLFRLREAGLSLIAVTGRPAGWGELLVRQWPIDGAVTENGAVLLRRDGTRVDRLDRCGDAERSARRRRIAGLVADLRERFPALTPADDVGARLTDFTFDIGERVRLPEDVIAEALQYAQRQGARTTRSSVHLHVSFDGDDKASGAVHFLGSMANVDATVARFAYAFIGDSQNDEACFGAFRTTIAVRNVTGRFTVAPRFVTVAPRGAGFVEAAHTLILRRDSAPDQP